MDQTSQTTHDIILATAWKITTQPNLYKQLALNPYSQKAVQIGQVNFPNLNPVDVVWAIVLSEPEGKYDRNFNFYPQEVQEAELFRQTIQTSEIAGRLNEYYGQNSEKFGKLSADLKYEILFKVAFETADIEEVEQKFSQGQRKSIKVLFINYIGKVENHSQIQTLPPSKNLFRFRPIKISKPGKKFSRSVIVILTSISLFFFTAAFLDNQTLQQRTRITSFPNLGQVAVQTAPTFPYRLKIPSINVDAAVESIGVTADGAMDVPSNTADVGWYNLGPIPGEKGSAVISGHFDGRKGESGVFNNLDKLKVGDKMYVLNNLGAVITFIVRESRIYKPGFASDVFYSIDTGAHLNLVTCDGIWDLAKKSYSKRLVVFSDSI